jgi:hypothetical protein
LRHFQRVVQILSPVKPSSGMGSLRTSAIHHAEGMTNVMRVSAGNTRGSGAQRRKNPAQESQVRRFSNGGASLFRRACYESRTKLDWVRALQLWSANNEPGSMPFPAGVSQGMSRVLNS